MNKVNLKIESLNDILRILKANIPLFLIIAFMVIVSFISSINGEFVSDDLPGLVRLPLTQDLNASFATLDPQRIIYGLTFAIFGLKPAPFHSVSIILHIINVILFFVITYNIYGKKVAALAASMYAVHPVVSETVIWISALNYQISTLYLYVCIILFLLYKKTSQNKWLIAMYIAFAIMSFTFSNYWVLIIPFFIAGLDFFILERNYKLKPLLKSLPLLLIGLGAFLLIRSGSAVTERVDRLNTPDATPYINRIPYSIYHATELFLYPKNLTIYHEGVILTNQMYIFMIIVSVVVVTSTFILWQKKKTRLIGGMIILIFISLLPVFSPILVAWMVAERYMYVGTGIFVTLIAMFFIYLGKKLKSKELALILTTLLVIIYSGRTIARAQEWKTRKSLWLSAEKRGPYSARAHNNLGDVYGIEKDWEKSIFHFKRAIEIKPDYSEAMHNLANTLMQLGYIEEARAIFAQSIQINPDLFQSYHKLGLLEYELGNPERAMQFFIKTLEIEPGYSPAIQSIQALQTLQQRNQ
ncbi:tetratricopeptide repeat protein [Patescibacteria group bacterium]